MDTHLLKWLFSSNRWVSCNYRSAIPATALRDVYKNATSGKHNVELAELLIQLVGVYSVSSAVQLNTLEKGVVTNSAQSCR